VPTVAPTPDPTPTKTHSPKPTRARPPCPSDGAPPPGHDKGEGGDRPCTGGKGKGHGNGHDKGHGKGQDGGVILLLPIIASTTAWAVQPQRLRGRRRTD
jgi:hypothetical protein